MRTPVATIEALLPVVRAESGDQDLRLAMAEAKLARPRIREHCLNGPRPCPWKGCRFNLSCDVTAAGSLQEHAEGESDCALDYAARGGLTLEEVGAVLGVTAEMVRKVEFEAIRKLRKRAGKGGGR